MTPTEPEVRAAIAASVAEWVMGNVYFRILGDDEPPMLERIVDTHHVTDEDFAYYHDRLISGFLDRTDDIEGVIRQALVDAGTEAVMDFLARFPWAPRREAVPA